MKRIINWVLAGIVTVLCSSIGKAQLSYTNSLAGSTLIYSNAFNGGAVNITNTTINYSAAVFGGSNNPAWIDALGGADTNAFYANGTIGTLQGDSAILPFKPTSNQVYTLTATVNFLGNPGSWIGAGFADNYTHEPLGNGRFTDALAGADWAIFTESSGALSYFAGPKTSVTVGTANFKPSTGTHTLTVVLDTTTGENSSNKWTIAGYLDGVPVGPSHTYSSNPAIAGLGLTQTFLTTSGEFQWLSLTLSAAQLVLVEQPASANVNEGTAFTNTVVAAGTPPFYYQWYNNGAAIADATNASLIINPVSGSNEGTNYYVIVTNSAYGAVTSSPAILAVNTSPQFSSADPITYTNLMTLLGGTNNGVTNYLGSSPTFSVSTIGLQPITYQWLTNGVPVADATNATFTFPNCQWDSPTNFAVIASNSVGTATNAWAAQYIPAPIAPYPQRVLADGAIGYWRLDETNDDPNQYNDGEICDDYISGNNGIYTNTALAQQPGYSATTDPTETAAEFGPYDSSTSCDANSIGTNIDFSGSSNAEFTVSVWANGGYGYGGTEPAPGGIVAKGYFNGEEFSLDDGSPGGDVRFEVRNAAGTAANADSTFQLGGNNSWNHLVGVCDESNGLVSLYINGSLVGQASINPNSGVEADGAIPIMIGARSTSATSYGDNQFDGALDDVAIFNYAMPLGQVAKLYGGPVAPYLIPPYPQTNIVIEANTTLTIPAAAFGTPPVGYYWTNLTTGAVIGSGTTNDLAALNATLTVPNASASLGSSELELVVTNAYGSTNYLVSLFVPPPAQTLDYSSPILYSNVFDGPAVSIGGTASTAANSLVGGTNAEWICTYTNNANSQCGTVYANGTLGTNAGCALVPFTPEPGYIYTMTASLTTSSSMYNWVAMGFTEYATQTNNTGFARFTDGPQTGYSWMYLQNATAVFEPGPTTSTAGSSINTVPTAPVTNTLQIVLNTVTNNGWTASAYVNGVGIGTNVYSSNPPIGFAGVGQNQFSGAPPTGIQWNYWTLSAVAPGGVPPYLLAPLPPANVELTNTTVTIPATAFGTGPMGYTWSYNNSTVLGSGTTNNTAPLSADLSVPSSSLGSGQLELTVTNAYGTNITLVTLISPINTNPTNIVTAVTNDNLYLSWPADHIGWQLQAQTNSNAIGLSNNWVNVTGSSGTNQIVVPMDLNNGSVFYRLTY